MSPILVVYYSRSGKTRLVAEKLATLLKADIEEIRETVDRSGVLGYILAGRDAIRKKETVLASRHSTAGRKLVFLGMPVWGHNPPPAVRAYLKAVDLKGVSVRGFATMEGSGGEKTLDKVAELVSGGLAARLVLKKPNSDLAALETALREWTKDIAATAEK